MTTARIELDRPSLLSVRPIDPPVLTALLALLAGMVIPALLAYGFATSEEIQVMVLSAVVLSIVAVVASPYFGLLLFVGLLYVRPEEMVPALNGMRLTFTISVVTLFVLWFKLVLNREQVVKTPVNGLIVAFGIIAVASTLTKGITSVAAPEIAKLVILVLLTLNLIRSPGGYRTLVSVLILFTTYLAVYSIYSFYSGAAMNYEGTVERSLATGIFGDPNDLAAAIVAGLALALSRIAQPNRMAQILYVAVSTIMVWGLLLTDSRGGMIALLTVCGGFFLAFQKSKARAIVLATVIGGLFLAFGPSRMRDFDTGEESASSRFVFWDNGIQQLLAHPLTGVGFDQFKDVNDGMTAHNSFVLCFAELGLPGYFCWMGCIYYGFRPRRGRAEELDPSGTRELLGARLALVGLLSACFWISRTYVPVTYLYMVLPIAAEIAGTGRTRLFEMDASETARDGVRILVLCVASILFIELIVRLAR